jgi:hypothetical protein
LVQLEDCVLHAIIAISGGKSSEATIDDLYLKVQSLEKDLINNHMALNWFHLAIISPPSVSPTPNLPSTPLPGISFTFTILIYYLT